MDKIICWDCKKTLEENEEYMPYTVGTDTYYKCKSCHEADPTLRNFQKTECYSRVVGYFRPIQTWHKSKQDEFRDRKEYTIGNDFY